MRVSKEELFNLMKDKLQKAGLKRCSEDISDVLTFADHLYSFSLLCALSIMLSVLQKAALQTIGL